MNPSDFYVCATPAHNGNGDGRWRLVVQREEAVHSDRLDLTDCHARAGFIEQFATKAGYTLQDLLWLDAKILAVLDAKLKELQQEQAIRDEAPFDDEPIAEPDVPPEFSRDPAEGPQGAAEGPKAKPRFTQLLTSAELDGLELNTDYLVEHVLVRGQPGVVGGRSKTLKTSTLIDLVYSLGTGTPFLGTFETQRARVAFWSGESGAPTIRAKARAVARSRGMELGPDDVLWSFDLPKLARADHLLAIGDIIAERSIDVVVIDPLYLSLLDAKSASNAGNVFAMGAALEPLTQITSTTGCTILLAHHFRKGAGDPDEPAALEDLSQSGVAEWARQWLLLARRSPYRSDGAHELWLRAGGSAGHSGLFALNVNEGDPDSSEARTWEVEVCSATDAREAVKREAEQRKLAQREQRDQDDCRKMLETLRRCPDGDTVKGLRTLAGLSNERAADALRTLVGEGRAEAIEIKKYRRAETGYRATGT